MPTPSWRVDMVRYSGPAAQHSRSQRASVSWCGTGLPAAVDRKPDVELSSPAQVHITYAVPADGTDQSATYASRIASDVEAMDTWWRGQDPGRTLRFDLFAFPGCATRYGDLDLGFVRLPNPASQYVGELGSRRLVGDLEALGGLSSDKNLIYYDGSLVFDQHVCGTTFVPPDGGTARGGSAGLAFVWLHSLCGSDVGGGLLAASVAAHELIHGLGALAPPEAAPNECPPPDDGHVCDSTQDILYPFVTSSTTLPTQILDFNRDDYYGHSAFWFDVQDSLWLTRLPQRTLTIDLTGSGKGTSAVQIVQPGLLECRQQCTVALDDGVAAALVARPGSKARFLGWSGACAGSGQCSLAMNDVKTVSAAFATLTFHVTVSVRGKGRIVSAPAGISCPRRCSAELQAGTTMVLRARPSAGYRFVGWSGSCRGSGRCVLAVDRDRRARALFKRR